jgi:hypothetical protein
MSLVFLLCRLQTPFDIAVKNAAPIKWRQETARLPTYAAPPRPIDSFIHSQQLTPF